MKQPDTGKIIFSVGGVLTILGIFLNFFNIVYAPYVFSAGAAVLIVIQLKSAIDNRKAETRQKRLTINGVFSTLMLGLAAYFMFTGSNTWVVAVLIYALTALFLSFRGNNN